MAQCQVSTSHYEEDDFYDDDDEEEDGMRVEPSSTVMDEDDATGESGDGVVSSSAVAGKRECDRQHGVEDDDSKRRCLGRGAQEVRPARMNVLAAAFVGASGRVDMRGSADHLRLAALSTWAK